MQIDAQNKSGRFNAAGRLAPEAAIELAVAAFADAIAERVTSILVNFKDLSLTRCLSVIECHHFGERLARVGSALEKVAFVTTRECIEPHAFLFTVARNRGLRIGTFISESEADNWLQC